MFVELQRVNINRPFGAPAATAPKLVLVERPLFVNTDHVISFWTQEGGAEPDKYEYGTVQFALSTQDWDYTETVTVKSIERLKEAVLK